MANGSDLYEISDSSLLAKRVSAEELGVVKKVVEDIVDYVIRKEEFLTLVIPYDSDYIPNSTEPEHKKDPCSRHFCQKGCVCRSLSQKVVTKHCKKEDCIFHCVCERRILHCLRNLPHRKTVKIMLSNSPDHSRKTTRHTGVGIDPLPAVEEFPLIDLSMDDDTEIPTIDIIDDETEENTENNFNNQRNAPKNLSLLIERNPSRVETKRNLSSFKEIFLWCATHGRYLCTCRGKVFDLLDNLLLPDSKTEPASQKASRHHFFNSEDHCARTVGSVFNYRLRNSSRIFAVKRDFEIKKDILSSSNSVFKIDLSQSPSSSTSQSSKVKSIAQKRATNKSKILRKRNSIHFNSDSLPIETSKVSSHSSVKSKIQLIFQEDSDDEQSEIRSTPPKICKIRAKSTSKILRTNNGNHSNCDPLPLEACNVASLSPEETKIQLIYHDNSDSSDEEVEDTSSLPKYGLLCLNGFGYLPIKEYSSTKLVFQHPVIRNIFVTKKDQDEANLWLNELLKSFVSSEHRHTVLQWVVVQRGVLKISKPFSIKNLKTDTPLVN